MIIEKLSIGRLEGCDREDARSKFEVPPSLRDPCSGYAAKAPACCCPSHGCWARFLGSWRLKPPSGALPHILHRKRLRRTFRGIRPFWCSNVFRRMHGKFLLVAGFWSSLRTLQKNLFPRDFLRVPVQLPPFVEEFSPHQPYNLKFCRHLGPICELTR
jgi:hypothetical protein